MKEEFSSVRPVSLSKESTWTKALTVVATRSLRWNYVLHVKSSLTYAMQSMSKTRNPPMARGSTRYTVFEAKVNF